MYEKIRDRRVYFRLFIFFIRNLTVAFKHLIRGPTMQEMHFGT